MRSVLLDGVEIYPSKIVCVGRNYVEHIRELNNEMPTEPVIFIKPNSSISEELNSSSDEEIHYEGEITFLVLFDELAGVGFGLDLTKRAVQTNLKAKGLPWERSKAFDRSAVFSEFVAFEGETDTLRMELWINGQLVQQGSYELMLNKPEALLQEVGRFLTLEEGDLLMTGTPSGVGKLNVGDRVTGRVYSDQRMLLEQSWVVQP